jgi:peroxiredoxin
MRKGTAPKPAIAMQVLPPVSIPVKCLAQGDRAPAFEMVDPAFGIIHSSQLLPIGPVLLTFYRGAWCQCCQIDLRDLANTMPSFRKKNVSVLAVFHGLNSEMNARIRQTYNLKFPLESESEALAALSVLLPTRDDLTRRSAAWGAC